MQGDVSNMIKLDESYISVRAIDNAYEEDTLVDLISDYINFGGDVKDIYEAIKESSIVSNEDVDKAIQYLKDNNLMEKISSDVDDDCISCYNEDEDNFKDDFCWVEGNAYLGEDVDIENVDVDTLTVGDLIAGAMDNMSDKAIDEDIKFFKWVARELGVKDYDEVVVTVDEQDMDPSLVLSDGVNFVKNGKAIKIYKSANMITELMNGELFLYFKTLDDAKRYIALANKFLNSDELSKDVFAYDENFVNESLGCYDDEGNYSTHEIKPSNIEEALNLLDKRTGNKHDLLNKFLSEKLDKESTNKLIDMLNENASIKDIERHLVEASGQYVDELSEFKQFIMDRVRNGDNGEFTFRFYDVFAQDKGEKWLRFNNFDYESNSGEIIVFLTNNKSTSDLRVEEAKKIKENLLECIKTLDNFIDGKLVNENVLEALYNQLSNAAYDCRDYLIRG